MEKEKEKSIKSDIKEFKGGFRANATEYKNIINVYLERIEILKDTNCKFYGRCY